MLKEKTSDVSMTNTNQGSGTAAEAAVPMSHGLWNTWRKNLLLFCLTGVYVELCLHLCQSLSTVALQPASGLHIRTLHLKILQDTYRHIAKAVLYCMEN